MESKESCFFFRGSFEDKKRRFVDEWGGSLGIRNWMNLWQLWCMIVLFLTLPEMQGMD